MATAIATWPTGAEILRLSSLAGELQSALERITWGVKPAYEDGDDEHQPTFEELGRLAYLIGCIETDLDSAALGAKLPANTMPASPRVALQFGGREPG